MEFAFCAPARTQRCAGDRSSNGGASSSDITSGLGDAGIANGLDPDDPDEISGNFTAPFILDSNNPNTMLAG